MFAKFAFCFACLMDVQKEEGLQDFPPWKLGRLISCRDNNSITLDLLLDKNIKIVQDTKTENILVNDMIVFCRDFVNLSPP